MRYEVHSRFIIIFWYYQEHGKISPEPGSISISFRNKGFLLEFLYWIMNGDERVFTIIYCHHIENLVAQRLLSSFYHSESFRVSNNDAQPTFWKNTSCLRGSLMHHSYVSENLKPDVFSTLDDRISRLAFS